MQTVCISPRGGLSFYSCAARHTVPGIHDARVAARQCVWCRSWLQSVADYWLPFSFSSFCAPGFHGARHCVCDHFSLRMLATYGCHSICTCIALLGSPHNGVHLSNDIHDKCIIGFITKCVVENNTCVSWLWLLVVQVSQRALWVRRLCKEGRVGLWHNGGDGTGLVCYRQHT